MSMPKLGQKVRDRVTGLEGVVTARVEYLTGCTQVCVQPRAKEDGTLPNGYYLDETRVEITGEKPLVIEGASRSDGPSTPPPVR